jgi:hypothetical protein
MKQWKPSRIFPKKPSHRPSIIAFAAMLLLTSCLIININPAHAALSWTIQTVDNSYNAIWFYNDVAIGPNGTPQISYCNAAGGHATDTLMYAMWDGTKWVNQTVDSSGYKGFCNAIAVGPDNYPQISYYYWSNALMYAKWDGTKWNIQTVDPGDNGYQNDIALDSSGNPQIAYYDYTNGALKYAAWDSSSSKWNIQTIDSRAMSGYNAGMNAHIAVDSSGHPRISYCTSQNSGTLNYTTYDGSAWTFQTIATGGTYLGHNDIAVGPDGTIYISYWDATTGHLMLATNTGSGWSTQTVDSTNAYVGAYNSIAVGPNGYPQIAYIDNWNHCLKYAAWTGQSWYIETVDSTTYAGDSYVSIAVDPNNPHISYQDTAGYHHYLLYATTTLPGDFFVVPEYLLGALLALAACFAAFAVFKNRQTLLHPKLH